MMQENQKRKKMKDDIWDISIYTDEEIIHNLLNMSNPTDRELEIKIWSSIQQYKTSPPTPENLRWMNFYEQIYHRLFSFSDEEEESNKVIHKPVGLELTESFELIEGLETKAPTTTQPPPKTDKKEEKEDDSAKSTKLVTQLQYATGNVNPLLKETLTRTLTIDSQYRDNKNDPTTKFILNLTETIKNVVNVSLYSIHIPFTWYTISTNYGSNYFYIQGTSPGIESYNYQVYIASGNYTQVTLAAAVNVGLQSIKTINTDICFGNTSIEYNPNNMIMTFTTDIQNIFNQHFYYLYFPTNITPNDPSYNQLRKTTIPSFLGLTNQIYSFDSIISSKNIPYTNTTTANYYINKTTDISNSIYPNNQIWIYQYQDTGIFNPSTSTILATYSITIENEGYYSRESLTNTINTLIQNSTFIKPISSYFEQIQIQDTSFSYMELNLELNRYTTINQQYLKTVIFLPDDTLNNRIWTGSCFQFVPRYPSFTINPNNSITPIGPYFPFYQNEIYSENQTLQVNYIIDTSASIIFTCINPYYNLSQNNYIVTITPSIGAGYILPEYINAINNAFNQPVNMASGLEISGNQFFNTIITQPFSVDSNNSIAYFILDMNKTFNQDIYTIDISTSPLYTELNIGNSYGYSSSVINLTDLSSSIPNKYQIDFSFGYSAIYDMSCDTLITIYPQPNTQYGNQNAPPFIIPPVYTTNNNNKQYNNITILQNDIKLSFTTYVDSILNDTPFSNTEVYINPNLNAGNFYNGYIIFSINVILTETTYSLSFYDPLASWSTYLYFQDNSGTYLNTDISYILSNYHISGKSYSEISGSNVVLNEIISIDNSNNQFSIRALSTSESLQSDANNYNYTIENGIYSRDQLLTKINNAFQSYNDTYNTFIGLKTINGVQYSYFYVEINKVFTSSDYSLVFYDSSNFQQCSVGKTNAGNASWDSTLGWILGFREYTTYELSNFISIPAILPSQTNPTPSFNDICKIIADTTCSTTLFNYFILTLDDFNQNHTNDGLVTITTIEKSIPLPTYANRSNFVCNPSTGLYLYTGITNAGSNNLTQNQIYSITEIMNNNVNAESLNGNVPISKYSYGPFISDVLAIVPIKTGGVTNGQTIIIDGGTLQTQNRKYFGPINLNRLLITLYDDRGHIVNLNNSNWSFTLLVDQIYKKSSASS